MAYKLLYWRVTELNIYIYMCVCVHVCVITYLQVSGSVISSNVFYNYIYIHSILLNIYFHIQIVFIQSFYLYCISLLSYTRSLGENNHSTLNLTCYSITSKRKFECITIAANIASLCLSGLR